MKHFQYYLKINIIKPYQIFWKEALLKICHNTSFFWHIYSRIRTKSKILSLIQEKYRLEKTRILEYFAVRRNIWRNSRIAVYQRSYNNKNIRKTSIPNYKIKRRQEIEVISSYLWFYSSCTNKTRRQLSRFVKWD